MSYTKGPWEFEQDDFAVYGGGDNSRHIASVTEAFEFPCIDDAATAEEQLASEANARLIAAAPDLLEALIAAKDWLYQASDEGVLALNTKLLSKIHDAIKKAEGAQ